MAIASWPLKVAAWTDDVFLLVSERLSCHQLRSTRARCIEPALHDIDMDTYDYSIAEACVQRSDNICLHVWAARTHATSAIPMYGRVALCGVD
jgi:hypothetical protein